MKERAPQLKIASIYAIVGMLWIYFSDRALSLIFKDIEVLTYLQTIKGTLYIVITTLLLYYLVNKDLKKIRKKEHEKEKFFNATIAAMQHILNNFLNKMMLFKIEAEKSKDFDKDTLKLYDDVIEEAEKQIGELSTIQELTEDQIKNSISPGKGGRRS